MPCDLPANVSPSGTCSSRDSVSRPFRRSFVRSAVERERKRATLIDLPQTSARILRCVVRWRATAARRRSSSNGERSGPAFALFPTVAFILDPIFYSTCTICYSRIHTHVCIASTGHNPSCLSSPLVPGGRSRYSSVTFPPRDRR
jgi:hypothetical protein